jgi:hypothetical protein
MATKKIKVSQSTINQIKNLGMTKALASAKSMKSNSNYVEGLRRMYGATRVNKALGFTGSSPVKMGGGSGRKTSSSPVKMGGGSGMKSVAKKTVAKKTATTNARFAQSNPAAQAAYKAKQAAKKSAPKKNTAKFAGFKGQYPK